MCSVPQRYEGIPVRIFVIFCALYISSVPLLALERDDLLFYAPFDGSLVAEVSAGNAEPIVKSEFEFKPGILGQGLVATKEVRYAGPGNMASEGTICFWAKPLDWEAADGHNHYFFNLSTATSHSTLFVLFYGMTRFWQYGKKQGGIDTYQTDFRKGAWRFVALSWRKDHLDLYTNGMRVGYRVEDVQPLTIHEKSYFSIITNSPTVIDELMIFKKALTLREIRALYYKVKRRPRAPRPVEEGASTKTAYSGR
jgi:hypothetical protein